MSLSRRAYWAGKRLLGRALKAMRRVTGGELDETDVAEGNVDSADSILCVVANIRETVPFAPDGGETRSGHRRLSAGTKVYVLAPSWD